MLKLHHPYWLQLVLALSGHLKLLFWLRITDEGYVPEMRLSSILLVKLDLKWCIHLRRSLFLYFNYLVSVTAGGTVYCMNHEWPVKYICENIYSYKLRYQNFFQTIKTPDHVQFGTCICSYICRGQSLQILRCFRTLNFEYHSVLLFYLELDHNIDGAIFHLKFTFPLKFVIHTRAMEYKVHHNYTNPS